MYYIYLYERHISKEGIGIHILSRELMYIIITGILAMGCDLRPKLQSHVHNFGLYFWSRGGLFRVTIRSADYSGGKLETSVIRSRLKERNAQFLSR
jgi:hypothetical protein